VSAEASLEFGVLMREIFFKAHETVPGKRLAGLGSVRTLRQSALS